MPGGEAPSTGCLPTPVCMRLALTYPPCLNPGVRISAKGKSPCVGPWLCRHTALSHQNQEPGAGREAPQGALHPCGVLWDKGLEPEPCVSTVEGAPRLGGLEAEWGRHPRKRWLQEEGGSQAPGFARGTNPAWCLGWG